MTQFKLTLQSFGIALTFIGLLSTTTTWASDGHVILAKQFHIINSTTETREPYGLLWRMKDQKAFDSVFGGPIRVALHTAEELIFPSLIPVHEDGSLDFERLRENSGRKQSNTSEFAEKNEVRYDKKDGSIWAKVDSKEVQAGQLLDGRNAYLCTGPYREVCSLSLDGRIVVIEKPIDWSLIHLPKPKVASDECSSSDFIGSIPKPLEGNFKFGLKIRIVVQKGYGTSCGELTEELQAAQKIFARAGIQVHFVVNPIPEENASFDLVYLDKVPLSSDSPVSDAEGVAVLKKKFAAVGSPRYGRRFSLVVAHEIGHMLGLEHSSDLSNLMVASGVKDDKLTPAQIEKMQKSAFLAAPTTSAKTYQSQ